MFAEATLNIVFCVFNYLFVENNIPIAYYQYNVTKQTLIFFHTSDFEEEEEEDSNA